MESLQSFLKFFRCLSTFFHVGSLLTFGGGVSPPWTISLRGFLSFQANFHIGGKGGVLVSYTCSKSLFNFYCKLLITLNIQSFSLKF